jgi:hypothetical protein
MITDRKCGNKMTRGIIALTVEWIEGFHGGDFEAAVLWDVTPYQLIEETSV